MILVYDKSFDGLLTCVFEVYAQKLRGAIIQQSDVPDQSLFSTVQHVETNTDKAERVWSGLAKKISRRSLKDLFCVYLSEVKKFEQIFLGYIQYAFSSREVIDRDFSNPLVLEVAKIAQKVHREKHRMEAFVRFQLTNDDIYYAAIQPDFNVLPLIAKHFKNRYADQQWIIYDSYRKYGLYYDKAEVFEMNFTEMDVLKNISPETFNEDERKYQVLWKDYFKSVNIESRKNMRLHKQHVPARYWKLLTEKQ